jgi:2-methylcitrate dehydratase PrpD
MTAVARNLDRSTPSGRTATERIAGFTSQLELADVPDAVREAAALHLLDALGCGLAARGLDASPYAQAYAQGTESGAASAIGVPAAVPATTAALVNGISCHTLDFDDTHARSITHVSAVIVPAALAAAQVVGATGGDLLLALIAGNEVTCTIGDSLGDDLLARGIHPTAICGVFGATAALARLHALEAPRTVHALGTAGSMAAGLLACLSDGTVTKRMHPGWMANAAQVAVRLAALGATGPSAVLEGPGGVSRALLGRDGSGIEAVLDGLGSRWETLEIAFKPYPACHFLHAAVDAVAALDAEERLEPDAIERITVFQPRAGIEMVLAPLARKRRPATAYEAKFSAPFAIGARLVRGEVGVTTFTDESLGDAEILRMAERVDYEALEYETYPRSFPGGVRVTLRSGGVRERHLLHQRGGAEHPMTAADVHGKFRANAELALPGDRAEGLRLAVAGVAGLPDLEPLRVLQEAVPV